MKLEYDERKTRKDFCDETDTIVSWCAHTRRYMINITNWGRVYIGLPHAQTILSPMLTSK